MEHLSQHSKKLRKSLLLLIGSKLFFISPLFGDVVSFYDPIKPNDINLQLFLANDPVSLYEMFHGWKRNFHAKNGKNLALADLRLDTGREIGDFHIAYAYRYNVWIKTQSDFTQLYYRAKNKIEYQQGKKYDLSLKIDAIKEHLLLVSRSKEFINNSFCSLKVGASLFFNYAVDMQDGKIDGYALTPKIKEYDIDASSSYHYTHNYLYKLRVDDSYGLGYGGDLALLYKNHRYKYDLKFIANDLLSTIYWHHLPYSYVKIKTANKEYDKSGFTKYKPTISGIELYKDYRQKIKTRWKIEAKKYLVFRQSSLSLGCINAYNSNFPYMKYDLALSKKRRVELSYESRFQTIGIDYYDGKFMLGVSLDTIVNPSAFGFRTYYNF